MRRHDRVSRDGRNHGACNCFICHRANLKRMRKYFVLSGERPAYVAAQLQRGSLRLLACRAEARRAKAGGAKRDRTADLLHAMQALSQLSYSPIKVVPFDRPWVPSERFARRGGGLLLLVFADSKPKFSA